MPALKPMTSMDISDIQRRMAQIRHDMHQEVQGAVKGAQSLTDWRSAVKSHPWLSISIASLAGYLIVPARRSTSPTIVSIAHPSQEVPVVSAGLAQKQQTKPSGWSILGTAFSLLAPIAVRGAQSYALGYLEQWLSQHPLPSVPGESPGKPPRESSHSASTSPADRLRKYG
jgi:hypothetical protein